MCVSHDFEFETYLDLDGPEGEAVNCKVEASITTDRDNIPEIKSVDVTRLDTGHQVVLADGQMGGIYEEIYERFEPDEPGDDWRNEWDQP